MGDKDVRALMLMSVILPLCFASVISTTSVRHFFENWTSTWRYSCTRMHLCVLRLVWYYGMDRSGQQRKPHHDLVHFFTHRWSRIFDDSSDCHILANSIKQKGTTVGAIYYGCPLISRSRKIHITIFKEPVTWWWLTCCRFSSTYPYQALIIQVRFLNWWPSLT